MATGVLRAPQLNLNNFSTSVGAKSSVTKPSISNDGGTADATATPQVQTSFSSSGKGGGAFRRIAENFDINPATGTLSLSVPIPTTPSRSSLGPDLSLSYDSGQGNGPFGFGWSLNLQSVSRSTAKCIPLYDDEVDTFVLAGNDELVPAMTNAKLDEIELEGFTVRRYLPRVIRKWQRIERWTSLVNLGDVHWRTISSDNVTSVFGETNQSRIFAARDGRDCVFSWLLCFAYDAFGNCMEVSYKKEDAVGVTDGDVPAWERDRSDKARTRQKYVKSIKYGNQRPNRDIDAWTVMPRSTTQEYHFEVVFDFGEHDQESPVIKEDDARPWETRKDPFSFCKSGFEIRNYRLCQRVLMFHHFLKETGRQDHLVSSTVMEYDQSHRGTFLKAIQQIGHSALGDPRDNRYFSERMPPLTFEYSQVPSPEELAVKTIETKHLYNIPSSLPIDCEWIDLNGEGIPGILSKTKDGTLVYQANRSPLTKSDSGFFESEDVLSEQPSTRWSGKQYFDDLDSSGQQDLVCLDEGGRLQGYFERRGSGQWSDFESFTSIPSGVHSSVETARVDLTGDGQLDLVYLEEAEGVIVWSPSLRKEGYGSMVCTMSGKNSLPKLKSDNMTSVCFIDMTGDGLSDLVQFTNGSIVYWPNLGYGTFGHPVHMGNAPRMDSETFTFARLHLSDVDGSGTTDMIYLLPGGGAHLYYNYAGNTWSDPILLSFPSVDSLTTVFAIDLVGKGTSCLCWSGPDPSTERGTLIRYLDLMGGVKPHLLCGYQNGIGLSTSVEYTPSTHFYLEDLANNRLWTTRLAFPVQCVSKVTCSDEIVESKKIVAYKYHDGYFDGAGREFNGFGQVDQRSEEIFTTRKGTFSSSLSRSKTWFNNGSPNEHSPQYASPRRLFNELSATISSNEGPEALRALKGLPIRTEVYDLTHPEAPCSTVEYSYTVGQLQRQGKYSKNGIYSQAPLQTLFTDSEGGSNDPRVSHDFVLEVNKFGNILKTAKILYPRKIPDKLVEVEQSRLHIELNQTEYTMEVDQVREFRTPLPLKVQKFYVDTMMTSDEIKNISKSSLMALYADNDASIDAKRLIVEKRTFYRNNNLDDRLKGTALMPYSIHDASYELAYTREMLDPVIEAAGGFNTNLRYDDLATAGGYEDFTSEGHLWSKSPSLSFSSVQTSSESSEQSTTEHGTTGQNSSRELLQARKNFFIPLKATDAFKNSTRTEIDEYALAVVKTTNPLGYSVSAGISYERMQPVHIVDENGNVQDIALDSFGDLVGYAMVGGHGDLLDSLDPTTFDPKLSQEVTDQFFAAPSEALAKQLLGTASRRIIRSIDRRHRLGSPFVPAMAEIARAEARADGNLFITITYFDGRGRPTQKAEYYGEEDGEWRISGCQIADSAGNVVRSFMPFFAETPQYFPPSELNEPFVHSFFDLKNQPIGRLNQDGSWTKTVYHPWQRVEYDAGDTAGFGSPSNDEHIGRYFGLLKEDSHGISWADRQATEGQSGEDAVEKSKVYHDTPRSYRLDVAGRVILATETTKDSKRSSRFVYDDYGNRVKTYDSRGYLLEIKSYNCLGICMKTSGIDSGSSWSFANCLGNVVYSGNSRKLFQRTTYDQLQRQRKLFLTGPNEDEKLIQVNIYGEDAPEPKSCKLVGRLWKIHDQSGIVIYDRYDHYQRNISSSVQYATEFKSVLDWKGKVELLPEVYRLSAVYDNAGRLIEEKDANQVKTRRVYTRLGDVKTVETTLDTIGTTEAVLGEVSTGALSGEARIAQAALRDNSSTWTTQMKLATFSPDRKPLKTYYGNDTTTIATYHPLSRKIVREVVLRGSGTVLEDLIYSYDILGRKTRIVNNAQEIAFFRNAKVQSASDYTHDAYGQLKVATGREQIIGGKLRSPSATAAQSFNSSRTSDGGGGGYGASNEVCEYVETYEYDLAGNMTVMTHNPTSDASVSGWARKFFYEEPSMLQPELKEVTGNRLSRTSLSGGGEVLEYDRDAGTVGCVTKMTGFQWLRWDHNNKLKATSSQIVNDGVPEITYYVYNHNGDRCRKITESASLDGSDPRITKQTFHIKKAEIFTRYFGDGSVKTQRCCSEVFAATRIALLESSSTFTDVLTRFQSSDRMELDDSGKLVSCTEHSPFGSCTYAFLDDNVVAPRKYRFARYLRDTETGLYVCGARYLVPWLARWLSPDPLGLADGLNVYCYVGNDPANLFDPLGTVRFNIDKTHIPKKDPDDTKTHRGEFYDKLAPAVESWHKAEDRISKQMGQFHNWLENSRLDDNVSKAGKLLKNKHKSDIDNLRSDIVYAPDHLRHRRSDDDHFSYQLTHKRYLSNLLTRVQELKGLVDQAVLHQEKKSSSKSDLKDNLKALSHDMGGQIERFENQLGKVHSQMEIQSKSYAHLADLIQNHDPDRVFGQTGHFSAAITHHLARNQEYLHNG